MMTVIAVIFCIWFVLVFCYMLAIMPRMLKRPDREPFLHVLYAHRGLHDNDTDAPENSMKAFEKAVEAGYGIELDIQFSADHIPVVFHDFTLDRVCGAEGKVCKYTYEELQQFRLCGSDEKIPRLVDVLRLVNGKVPLIIEFKAEWQGSELCYAADLLLQNYEGDYCIESFNPLILLWYRRHNRKVMRGQLSDAFGKNGGEKYRSPLYRALENLLFNFLAKPDFIAYNHKFYRNRARCICRYVYGGLAAAWTVRSQEELDARREDFDIFIFDSFIPKENEELKALQKSLEEQAFEQETMNVEQVKRIVAEMDRISPVKKPEAFAKEEVWNRVMAVCSDETKERIIARSGDRFRKKRRRQSNLWPVAVLTVTVAGAVFLGTNFGICAANKKGLHPDFEELTVFNRDELPEDYKETVHIPFEAPETIGIGSIKVWIGDKVGYQVTFLDEQTENYLLIIDENN